MRRGLFDPWEMWRKALGLSAAAFVVILVVALSLPLGGAALVAMVLAAQVWKNPRSGPDYDRVSYTMYTRSFRVAFFFDTVRTRMREVFSPVVVLSAGPPLADEDHDLQPGFFPLTRLSSWWSLLFAVALAPLEIAVNAFRFPTWGSTLPWPIMAALSVPFWFVTFQAWCHVRRIQPDAQGESMVGQPAPAVMLHKLGDHVDLKPSLVAALIKGSVALAIIVPLWAATKWPWWLTIIAGVVSVALIAAMLWSRDLTALYREQWTEREQRADWWNSVWVGTIKAQQVPPRLRGEFDFPLKSDHEQAMREWEQELEDGLADLDSSPPEYEVLVKMAAFDYPPGMTFSSILPLVESLRGPLNASHVAVTPVGELDALGREIPGTVSGAVFRLFYSARQQLPSILDPSANYWVTELLIHSRILAPLSNVRGIGPVVLTQRYDVTRTESPQRIIGLKLRPLNPQVSVESFLERLQDIQRAAQVPWVRVSPGSDSSEVILYFGHEPVHDVTVFSRPTRIENDMIDRMNWLYYFYANGLRGQSGTPRLVKRVQATQVVDNLTFSLPPGLPMKKVKDAEDALASTSGNEFIEISLIPPPAEAPTKVQSGIGRGRPTPGRQQEDVGTQFSVVASRRNPLRRTFNFTDFADKVMTGRQKGVAKINWAAGVLSDDTLAYDDWGNADSPHLLVAGASGSGKSVAMSSMILQIAHNNGPGEARFWMIEPKNEMQIYRDLDVVEHFVDSWTPDGEFVKNAANLVEMAVKEMERRNEAFVRHPKQPKQLRKAREIAVRESEQSGTPLEDHPLYMPYIFLIIEECASLFAGVRPAEKEDQLRLMGAATEIARKARSAGIHLILATQYPTKESLPVTIRNQCRSIGFRCQNEVASRVVINETGLENVTIKGAGKLRAGDSYRLFRGFWVQDGDPDYNEANDIVSTLALLPSNNGHKSALRGPGEHPRITVPTLGESVFELWNRSEWGGRSAAKLVTSGEGGYQDTDLIGTH